MRIRAGYEITFDSPAPTPMLLMLNVRPERLADLETPDVIRTDPYVPIRQYRDGFGNLVSRIIAPAGRLTLSADFVVRDGGQPEPAAPGALQHAIEDLPDGVIPFLLGSRYCDVQEMNDLAWRLFGEIQPGWARVEAIVEYVHRRLAFGYEHASPRRTAFQAHELRAGVCRDYAHLAITLCRCVNIPARYATGYLGDIGVPPCDLPMDFAAYFEAFLDGRWHAFDPRHNARRVGRIPVAFGRDAVDCAITTQFGPTELVGFDVITEEIRPEPRAGHSELRAGA